MGLTYVTVALSIPGSSAARYSTEFLVDTGATDTLAPASELHGKTRKRLPAIPLK
jgi:hypothetical protein